MYLSMRIKSNLEQIYLSNLYSNYKEWKQVVINLNSLACKIGIIMYQNLKIYILKA